MNGDELESGTVEGEDHAPVAPLKVCSRCSVQTQTSGAFCPECGAPYAGRRSRKKAVITVMLAVLLVVAATGTVLVVRHNNQVHAEARAAEAASEAAAALAKQKAAADAAAAQTKLANDTAEREVRASTVKALEASIVKDAKTYVKSGVLTGPILAASCTPLGGGSVDDLTALTGTFECIAVNKKSADGTESGYRYSATINWTDSSYTWHLGS